LEKGESHAHPTRSATAEFQGVGTVAFGTPPNNKTAE
jgi:hypothetical protein